MDLPGSTIKNADAVPPISCLRLLVPPLQLVSAAMWHMAKPKNVMHYGRVEEFVLAVTEAVPGVVTASQRAQLLLGLRARLILELCKGSSRGDIDLQVVQTLLARLPVTPLDADARSSELQLMEATFTALVQSLLKDPVEREYFFQEVFPVEYGAKYNAALQQLMWALLTRLEKMCPAPDLKQTVAWLSAAPSVLEDCVYQESMAADLSWICQHHQTVVPLKATHDPPSTRGSCILSALSVPPSQKTQSSIGRNYGHLLVDTQHYSLVTVYTQVEEQERVEESGAEVDIQTFFYEPGDDALGGAHIEALQEDNKGSGPEDAVDCAAVAVGGSGEPGTTASPGLDGGESYAEEPMEEYSGAGDAREPPGGVEEAAPPGGEEEAAPPGDVEDAAPTGGVEEAAPPGGEEEAAPPGDVEDAAPTGGVEEAAAPGGEEEAAPPGDVEDAAPTGGVEDAAPPGGVEEAAPPGGVEEAAPPLRSLQLQNASREDDEGHRTNKVDMSIAPSVIAIRGVSTDSSGEMTSIIFTCPHCPFQTPADPAAPHIHMQLVATETYKALTAERRDGARFTPTPLASDQIFTSIRLIPRDTPGPAHDPGAAPPAPGMAPPGRRGPLECETCGKAFTRTSDVRRHQMTHTGERPYHCSLCQRTFKHSWDLAKHEAGHGAGHGAGPAGVAGPASAPPARFPCMPCGAAFANLRSLSAHHRSAHAALPPPRLCSICGRGFSGAAELREHRRCHGAAPRHLCQLCGEAFDTLQARSQHRRAQHARRQFPCSRCGKTYTRRSDVRRHQASHTGERPHHCPQCGKSFALRFALAKHLNVHVGARPFPCAHCPKSFTLAPVRARHERTHTGERPFLCAQCGKRFLSQGELSKHQRAHGEERPFGCTRCPKRFKSKVAQQEHTLTHAGARPYPCAVCGKGFTKLYALKRHRLTHTGERPYACGHCSKGFLTASEAALHRRVHTGERPYACGQCDMRFKSSSEMGRHRKMHAGGAARLKTHLEEHQGGGEGQGEALGVPGQ